MDRFRKNLRDSFRKKKDHVPDCSKPHQWQSDESAVRSAICSFSIKYLGCVEVFESRGMQVCEEALKVLRNSRRRPIKGTLYVTGDGLRVVDDETKGLLVDQTIEKVSFCAPDRNHEKGFSYICRDGTTRRWMCHGFVSVKESGERLSHAVGCAFAVCLERKQKRDKETVVMTFDPKTVTFTRTGSFRQTSLTERMQNPQECKPTEPPPPLKPVHNPFAIERPHATTSLLQRQGSFRGFSTLNQTSPFKRQLSLRLSELPSTLERQQAVSLEHTVTYPEHKVDIPWIQTDKSEPCGKSLATKITSQHFIPCASSSDVAPASTSANNISESSNLQDTNNVALPIEHLASSQPVIPPRLSNPNFSHLSSDSLTESSFQATNKSTWYPDLNIEQQSVNNSQNYNEQENYYRGNQLLSHNMEVCKDPFDAEWAAIATRNQPNTNPFSQNLVKAFEVHM